MSSVELKICYEMLNPDLGKKLIFFAYPFRHDCETHLAIAAPNLVAINTRSPNLYTDTIKSIICECDESPLQLM